MNQQTVIDSFSGEYVFLSNGYPCYVWYDGYEYSSVEHAYQAAKTYDLQWRKKIRNVIAPFGTGGAKQLGRKSIIRVDWEIVKLPIMVQLVYEKFLWNKECHDLLLETGDAELIEGNWWGDTYWGVCNGVGENKLGQILMEVRKDLKSFAGD